MARIMMKKAHNESISEAFEGFMLSAQSRGLTDKTLASYRTHFHSISKRLDTEMPISKLTKKDLKEMIAKMREENLTDTSINSYTRTLKVFFSWCNEEMITDINIKLYKASETVKETYYVVYIMIFAWKNNFQKNKSDTVFRIAFKRFKKVFLRLLKKACR